MLHKAGNYFVQAEAPPGSTYASSTKVPFTIPGLPLYFGGATGEQPKLALRTAAITGTVYEPGGTTPVADAHVEIHDQNWQIREEGQTGEDGRFYLPPLNAGDYYLEVMPPPGSAYSGISDYKVTVTGEPQDLGALALTEPSITGVVYAPDGVTPVPFTGVCAHTTDWTSRAFGCTDENGCFKLGGLTAGTTYLLEAFAPPETGYSDAVPWSFTYTEPVFDKVVCLTHPTVVGWVYEPDGITPVQDAHICLHTETFSFGTHAPPTGADGYFAMGGVPDGSYFLEVMPPFSRPDLLYTSATVTVSGGAVTEVTGGTASLIDGRIVISFAAPTKTITGTVYKDGAGLSGAKVFTFREGAPGYAETLTGADGNYSFGVSGGSWMVMVDSRGKDWCYTGYPKKVEFKQDDSSETQTVNFDVVAAGAIVTGKILAPDGSTLPADVAQTVHVEVRNDQGAGNSGQCDASSNFSISVPPGTYKVCAFLPPDSSYGSPAPVKITVTEATYDVGSLKLQARNATITGTVRDSSGTPVASVPVIAFGQDGPGFAKTASGADGAYTLSVTPGKWGVSVDPMSDVSYVVMEPPVMVEVAADGSETVNFTVFKTDATINGRIINSNGAILTNANGFAVAMQPGNPGGIGAPVQAGSFTLKVPAGTHEIMVGLDPASGYSASGKTTVTVTSSETRTVNITVVACSSKITGTVKDSSGSLIPGVHVTAFNPASGAVQECFSEDGNYSLNVVAGDWMIGCFTPPDSGYVSKPPGQESLSVTVADGQTVVRDISLQAADATIAGTVYDPDGNPVSFAHVFAHGPNGDVMTKSGSDGKFALQVPAGLYDVGAALPPDRGYINPEIAEIEVASGETAALTLAFKAADATISVSVYKDGAPYPAHVWAWSDKGGFTEGFAADGSITLNAVQGDVWHVGAATGFGKEFYEAAEVDVDLTGSASGSAELQLAAVTKTIPDAVSVTFDASTSRAIDLDNGTSVYIPAGAIETQGNITVTASPQAGLKRQRTAKPVSLGYDLKALDSSGQEITHTFYKNVNITIPYDEDDLTALSINEEDLAPAYWDEETSSWKPVSGAVVDTTENTVTLSVDHFTAFGVVGVSRPAGDSGDSGGNGDSGDSGDSGSGSGGTSTTVEDKGDTIAASELQVSTVGDVSAVIVPEAIMSDHLANGAAAITVDLSQVDNTFEVTLYEGSVELLEEKGASIILDTMWADLIIPPGTVSGEGDLVIKVEPVTALSLPPSVRLAGDAVNIEVNRGDSAAQLAKRVTLILVYNQGADKDCVFAYRVNDNGSLTCLGGKAENGKVSVDLSHLSKYAVLEYRSSFGDITGHWAKRDILFMGARGLVKGTSATSFAPERPVTRAEFAALLLRVIGISESSTEQSSFVDVSPGKWYCGAVEAAYRAGLITGVGNNRFAPDRQITRAEIAVLMARALKKMERSPVLTAGEPARVLGTFKDGAAIATWATADAALAVKAGVVTGTPDGRFAPGAEASRAEATVMLKRLLLNLNLI